MANRTNISPWVIDTPSATALTQQKMRIQKIRWDGASNGATVVITNTRVGLDVFWASTSSGVSSESDQFRGVAADCDGVIVPTLTSGKLYIYYD